MRILVTGAGGFVGRYVARELAASGHSTVAFDLAFSTPVPEAWRSLEGDLLDVRRVNAMVSEVRPDACIHLGAMSFVPAGDRHPERMFAVNVQGTINVLEAFRHHCRAASILVVSSAHVYGSTTGRSHLSEDSPMAPVSTYAVSKAAADLASLAYAGHYGIHTMSARPNNHTGPGQSVDFVVASLVRQARMIADGKAEPVIKVGNVDSKRDFSDVRDVARAYRLLIEKGRQGQAYNISSHNTLSIGAVLSKLCELAGIRPEISVDPEKFRPTDSSASLDTGKLQRDTGWIPRIDFTTTLSDMLSEAGRCT